MRILGWPIMVGLWSVFHLQQPSSPSHTHHRLSHLFLIHHHYKKGTIAVHPNCTNNNHRLRNWHSGSHCRSSNPTLSYLGATILSCHCRKSNSLSLNNSKLPRRHLGDNSLHCLNCGFVPMSLSYSKLI